MNIIIFPFAGGSQYAYTDLKKHLPTHQQVVCLDYPGHGRRMTESLMDNLDDLVSDAYQQIKDSCVGEFIFWGHSMGAVMAFLLCHKLMKQGKKLPKQVIVSGRNAPNLLSRKEKISHLPKAEFIDKLRDIGGTPEAVLINQDLLDLFEPILRNDFKALEGFQVNLPALPIPFQVWTGSEESLNEDDINDWQLTSIFPIAKRVFPGNHFFIYQHLPTIAELLMACENKIPVESTNTT